MFKVYLAGFIQGAVISDCVAWRKKVRDHYAGWDRLIFLDPLNGKEITTISADGLKSSIPPHAIIHRDYQSVIQSNLIIVNMNTFGQDRPLTGTICELAWAWANHIPIIMITNESKYNQHPFLTYFASMIFESVEEMLEAKALNYFYKGQNHAIY